MIEAQIASGDFVLIRPQRTACEGDIVVADIPGVGMTLKWFYRHGTQVRLQPANKAMAPLIVDTVKIRGKVLAILRDPAAQSA